MRAARITLLFLLVAQPAAGQTMDTPTPTFAFIATPTRSATPTPTATNTGVTPTATATPSLTSLTVFNVTNPMYGAIPNDGLDDSPALVLAQADCLATGGGIIFFPPGTFKLSSGITLSGSNCTWKGSGMYASIIDASSVTNGFVTATGVFVENVAFEDLGWLHSTNSCINANGGLIRGLRITRNHFKAPNGGSSLIVQSIDNFILEGSIFDSDNDGRFLQTLRGSTNVVLRNNVWRNGYEGFIIDTGSPVASEPSSR